MSVVKPPKAKQQTRREGLQLLAGIVALMWIVEVINTLDSNQLDSDGIYARNVGRLWGILTAPFLHVSFAHLLDNTVPFVFMGVIIALRGAVRVGLVTLIVIVVGGLGTWLISPAHAAGGRPLVTVGASGVVFGYATYLLTRGFFDRSVLELLTGAVVGVIWGGVLLSSLVPQQQISWQGHLCGGIGGVVAAWLARDHLRSAHAPGRRAGPGTAARARAAGVLSK
ncbi:MAG: rhomboid family intramembrane serine protease [Solirubrobacteraceae bacterium]